VGPEFLAGSLPVNGLFQFLTLPTGNNFGYYSQVNFPFLFHQDMGYEYFVDADAGDGECYLFDFGFNETGSQHWLFTSRHDFPFLFDFTLNTWLYYAPNTNDVSHYTTNPRFFFNFNTMQWTTNL
jgi:hypothetical protein